jgi:hypothetical protein
MLEALAGFAPAFAFDDAFVAATRVVPMVHQASGMPVDIMLAGPGLEELFIGAAEPTLIAGVEVPVIRAEHLVVMKILTGRPRDLEDVAVIVAVRAESLDRSEVEQTHRDARVGSRSVGPAAALARDRASSPAKRPSASPRRARSYRETARTRRGSRAG